MRKSRPKTKARRAKRLPDRVLLPVEGLYGTLRPSAVGPEGPYYGEQQQAVLGIDQYGRVTNHTIRAQTSARIPMARSRKALPKQGKLATKVSAAAKAKAKAKAEKVPTFQEAVEQTDHNRAIVEAVWAGRKPKSAAKYRDEGGELYRVGYPDGYVPDSKSVQAHATLFDRKVPANSTRAFVAPKGKVVPLGAQPPRKVGRPAGSGGTGKFDASARITLLVKENPKKAGSASHARFALYRNGMTVEQFVKAGGTVGDVKWDVGHGFIKVG